MSKDKLYCLWVKIGSADPEYLGVSRGSSFRIAADAWAEKYPEHITQTARIIYYKGYNIYAGLPSPLDPLLSPMPDDDLGRLKETAIKDNCKLCGKSNALCKYIKDGKTLLLCDRCEHEHVLRPGHALISRQYTAIASGSYPTRSVLSKKIAVVDCRYCAGSGLELGQAREDGLAIVCRRCDGVGSEELEFSIFTGRKRIKGVKRVCNSVRGQFFFIDGDTRGDENNQITYDEFLQWK